MKTKVVVGKQRGDSDTHKTTIRPRGAVPKNITVLTTKLTPGYTNWSNPGGRSRRAVSGRRALRPPRVVFVIGLVFRDKFSDSR